MSFPVADSPRTATVGSPAVRASSCPCACSRAYSAACFSSCCSRPSTAVNCISLPRSFNCTIQLPSPLISTPSAHAEWVVYAKAPFAGPQQVLDYVGRYTHRVAISNNRLLDIEDGQVQFRYKDYRNGSQQKVMTLSADEFIRRFLLHVLPDGFQRIRYYGFLSNRHREEKLERCRQLLGMESTHSTTPSH